jgi:hypothetical protein
MSIAVKVTRSGDANRITAKINKSSLKFDADGNSIRALEPGAHTFTWRVHGSKKQTYNVRVVAPQRAAGGGKGVLTSDGVVIGIHKFTL